MEEHKTARSKSKRAHQVIIEYNAAQQSTSSFIATIVVSFLFVGSFYLLAIILLVSLYFIIVHQNLLALSLLLILIASTFYPSQILWQGFIDSSIWRSLCQYFSFKVIVCGSPSPFLPSDDQSPPSQRYIFVEFPHGVIPMGFMLSSTIAQRVIPGVHAEGAVASVLFNLPFIGHIAHWFGGRPATSQNIRNVLNRGNLQIVMSFLFINSNSGHSVAIMAGGIAELFLSSREQERVYLKNRKGFVKIAIEKGVPLVPVYYFGNTHLFDFVTSGFMAGISRKLRTSLLVFYGRWYLPIPYQHPILMVIGEPIHVQQNAKPTQSEIEEVHRQFVHELQKLFDDFKGEIGWEAKELEVL